MTVTPTPTALTQLGHSNVLANQVSLATEDPPVIVSKDRAFYDFINN